MTTKGTTKIARRKHVASDTLTVDAPPSPNGNADKPATDLGEHVAVALAALAEIDLRRVKDQNVRADLKAARTLLTDCARKVRRPE